MEEERERGRLQPIMLIMLKRLECGACGSLAVILDFDETEEKGIAEYAAYCQDCWHNAVVEANELC